MKLIRAWSTLTWLSFRRLLWSANSLMVLLPLAACALFVMHRRFDRIESAPEAFKQFSEFVLFVVASFLVPICALGFGTTSLGGDREDQTLVFLLVRPLPRALILLAKFTAAVPLTLACVAGSFWLYCWLAGPPGDEAWTRYWPALISAALAYLGLFHLFAVAFRHATIFAIVYALFMETLLGNMPGIVKQVAINYYARSVIYLNGKSAGLPLPNPRWFDPMSEDLAMMMLWGIAAGGLLMAAVLFSVREYRDLT